MADPTPMDFTVTHQQNPLGGQRIAITVKAKVRLVNVKTVLDDITLDDHDLDPHGTSYSRSFPQVSDFHPGSQHTVIVSGTDEHGFTDAHHETWTDE